MQTDGVIPTNSRGSRSLLIAPNCAFSSVKSCACFSSVRIIWQRAGSDSKLSWDPTFVAMWGWLHCRIPGLDAAYCIAGGILAVCVLLLWRVPRVRLRLTVANRNCELTSHAMVRTPPNCLELCSSLVLLILHRCVVIVDSWDGSFKYVHASRSLYLETWEKSTQLQINNRKMHVFLVSFSLSTTRIIV